MKFSIIVPFYNVDEAYLKKCIESITGQGYRDFEIIVVNDGSTHGDYSFVGEISKSDNRVIYVSQENAGVSVARNTGLDRATGDYVIFVDGDDYVSEGILEAANDKLEKNSSTDMLVFGYCTNYTNRELTRVLENPNMSVFEPRSLQLAILQGDSRLGPVEMGTPWSKIIKRSVIEDGGVRYTKGLKKGQDSVFMLKLLDYCKNIDYLPFAGYHYRMSGASISHRYNPDIIEIMEKTFKEYENFAGNKDAEFKRALSKKAAGIVIAEYCDLYFMNKKNPKRQRVIFAELLALIGREPYKSALAECIKEKPKGLFGIQLSLLYKRHFRLLKLYKRLFLIAKWFLIRDYS